MEASFFNSLGRSGKLYKQSKNRGIYIPVFFCVYKHIHELVEGGENVFNT